MKKNVRLLAAVTIAIAFVSIAQAADTTYAIEGVFIGSTEPLLPSATITLFEPVVTLGVITCTAVAVPPIVRSEGIAELVGDIILTCTNTPPPSGGMPVSHLVTNVNVSLNVNVTNNLQGHPDAVLIINENNCTAPVTVGGSGIGVLASTPSCATASIAPPAAAPDQRFQDPMFGELASATRIEWNAPPSLRCTHYTGGGCRGLRPDACPHPGGKSGLHVQPLHHRSSHYQHAGERLAVGRARHRGCSFLADPGHCFDHGSQPDPGLQQLQQHAERGDSFGWIVGRHR